MVDDQIQPEKRVFSFDDFQNETLREVAAGVGSTTEELPAEPQPEVSTKTRRVESLNEAEVNTRAVLRFLEGEK